MSNYLIKNRNQEICPIQIQYHFQDGLQNYYNKFYSFKLEFPNFSDKCLICGSCDCAGYHGYYTRTVICLIAGFYVKDFPVMRYMCKKKNITFSLLPLEFVPFRQLTLRFMIFALYLRLKNNLSLFNAMDTIEKKLNNLKDIAECICISNQISWEIMIKKAFKLFVSSDLFKRYKLKSDKKRIDNKTNLIQFVEVAKMSHIENGGNTIRGPDALAFEYYLSTNDFLFGTPSQHRKNNIQGW